jgi:hypothetical protein
VPEVEIQADDGEWFDCAVCGRRRHRSERCGCGAEGAGPAAPAGWEPVASAGGRPRLPLTGRPAPRPPAGTDPAE